MRTLPTAPRPPISDPHRGAPTKNHRLRDFVVAAAATSLVFGGFLLAARHQTETPPVPMLVGIALMVACTVMVVRWLGQPSAEHLPGTTTTHRARFALTVIVTLFGISALALFGYLLYAAVFLTGLAAVVILRTRPTRREWGYAVVLAALTTLGASFADGWLAALQFAVVASALLGGWAIARHTGLFAAGVGVSRFLQDGAWPALRSFLIGAAISIPWALGNLVFRPFEDDHVHRWWEPVAALQPGIGEEAWARVLLIPLLFLLFARVATPRTALLGAFAVGTFWFALIHTFNPLLALILWAAQVIPMGWLWLRRDLETAIGFHFFADFLRFAAAYLFIQGMWFT
jgi:hypothetical protein